MHAATKYSYYNRQQIVKVTGPEVQDMEVSMAIETTKKTSSVFCCCIGSSPKPESIPLSINGKVK